PPTAPAARSADHRRVLVVDDNLDSAELLALNVQMGGHDVVTAHNGESALGLAAAYRPDVVLLDLGMPGMDGYEVAARLREVPGLEAVRIVAVTGYGEEEHRRRTRSSGFAEHLVKPVDLSALLRTLEPHDQPGAGPALPPSASPD
ncbi:MAG TPA: response regulator, partial [Vicinamibacterales bacterium]|nr:response regulator [Vicinamibacterales bacterium]